jgi:molybdopterin-containing oxidoreductase family iron-sulfur binding subunit
MVLILQTYLLKLEGRPIKIDNNISGARFSANARIHASILSLTTAFETTKNWGKDSTWTSVDAKN